MHRAARSLASSPLSQCENVFERVLWRLLAKPTILCETFARAVHRAARSLASSLLSQCENVFERVLWSDIGFESALEHAFERQLGPEFRSQLHLVRSAICKLGRSRTVSERAAPKIYSSALSQEELQALFGAYAGATDSVAHAVT